MDYFVYGKCERLSPERPCPVFVPISRESNTGMAGNVEANLRTLGQKNEVVTLYPIRNSTKTRYVDSASNQHLLRVDVDEVSDTIDVKDFISKVKVLPDIIILSDYAKSFLDQDSMGYIAGWGKKNRVPVFCDTKALLGSWSRFITFVKINVVEFNAQLRAGVKPWEECEGLIVTKGSQGADLYDSSGSIIYHVDSVGGDVIDVVGAGDTFHAALAIGYLESKDIRKAMDFAIKAAAVAVSKRGVVAVKREEVL